MPGRTLMTLWSVFALACSRGYQPAPARPAEVRAGAPSVAYQRLASSWGPTRFAQVTPTLYRGGQPNDEQLAELAALGVRNIVTFVDEPEIVRAETEAAERLGMAVQSFPFSGLREPDPLLLRRIVDVVAHADGPTYVHCRQGRDRTSLVVALYRVLVERWPAERAWRSEALEFGHGGLRGIFFRRLDRAYARLAYAQ